MTIGSWQPTPSTAAEIEQQELNSLLECLSHQSQIQDWVEENKPTWQKLAYAENAAWRKVGETLSPEQLQQLIRFFTVQEQEQNWDMGERSPVIPLFKIYKKENGIDKALVQWIKANTSNKYLPFGPLL